MGPETGAVADDPAEAKTMASRERDRMVKKAFHDLWLRGLQASALRRYGVAIVAAVGASLIRILLNPFWGTNFLPYVFLFPATLFSALFGGLGPAALGIAICAVMAIMWILPPIGSLFVASPLDLVGLAAFIVADGVIAWIGALHRDLIAHSERQSAELAMRKQEAEAANRAKDDFLAVLSHELRTPLTTIVAGVRVLRQIERPDATGGKVRDAIERQADQLTRLVDDLLDVKRIVTGPVVLQLQPFNLADAIAGFFAAWNGAGRFNDHTLLVDTEPVWANGDADRLQQVVDNLISNAIKYTPAGGSISISIKPEAEDAVLRVQDTGIGISPDLLPKVFELFMQGDPVRHGGSERAWE